MASISKSIIDEKLLKSNEITINIIKNVIDIFNTFLQKIPVFAFSKNVIILIFCCYDVGHGHA